MIESWDFTDCKREKAGSGRVASEQTLLLFVARNTVGNEAQEERCSLVRLGVATDQSYVWSRTSWVVDEWRKVPPREAIEEMFL